MRSAVIKSLPARAETARVLVAKRNPSDVPGGEESGWSSWKQHRDFEAVDEVRISVSPRWKTSDLSGDEWRTSAWVEFRCKGILVLDTHFRDVDTAAAAIPWLLMTFMESCDNLDKEAVKAVREAWHGEACMQPGCCEPATHVYQIITEYSREGFTPRNDTCARYMRAFCDAHSARGDCGLEDADANYIVLEAPEGEVEKAAAPRRPGRRWLFD